MKIQLELNIVGNVTFLNFWNYINGDDVNCEIINDDLFLMEYDEHYNIIYTKISLSEFCKLIKSKMES